MAVEPLAGCTWPLLAEPYAAALDAAVRYIFDRWEPRGVIASGTIIRGTPAPASDLDLFVLHDRPERQRVQRFFHGIPAEIFVNPPRRVAGYFESDRRAGTPITAHLIATGFVVYQVGDVVAHLKNQAQAALAHLPEPTDALLTRLRYMAATWFEDAVDVAETDTETCTALLCKAVEEAIRYRFWEARQWQPRPKDVLRALQVVDDELARLVRAFYRPTGTAERLDIARQIVAHSVRATGFFEWESEVEAVGP